MDALFSTKNLSQIILVTLNKNTIIFFLGLSYTKLIEQLTDSILVEISSLYVHALDDALEFRAHICELLSLLIGEGAIAQLAEVFTSLRSQVAEELNQHLIDNCVDAHIDIHVLAPRSVLNQVLVGVMSLLLID